MSDFAHVRSIPQSNPGWVELTLDLPLLVGRDDVSDVRIVDRSAHQIPYVEAPQRSLRYALDVAHAARSNERGLSDYVVALPYGGTPRGTLEIETDAPLFEREISLTALPGGSARNGIELARLIWSRTKPHDPVVLPVDLRPLTAAALQLSINDGDNAPLPIRSMRIVAQQRVLRFFHPGGGDVRLLYGNRRIAAPRYDLALGALDAGGAIKSLTPGPEVPPTTTQPSRTKLTGAVIAATLLLGLIFARLLRQS